MSGGDALNDGPDPISTADGPNSRLFLAGDGRLRLDPVRTRVELDGETLELGARSFTLLHTLMRHPMQLLSKDKLIELVWEGRAVSDAVLTTAIRELRRALNDDAKRPFWIKTEHGRGYRFIARVTEVSQSTSIEERRAPPHTPAAETGRFSSVVRRRLVLAAASAGAALIAFILVFVQPGGDRAQLDRSVAVLSFESLSPGDDIEWFAAGLAEELTNALTRMPYLHVASRRASDAAASQADGTAELGDLLGVAHLLEGSVRQDNGMIRVSVSLISADDGAQVWSGHYDRAFENILEIQSEISSDLANLLDTALDPETLRGMVSAGTESISAYEAYLRGQAAMRRFSQTGDHAHWRAAGDFLDRARSIDPTFAEAHAAAALVYRYENTPSLVMRPNPDTGETYRREYTARMGAAIAGARSEIEAAAYRARRDQELFELTEAAAAYETYLEERPNDWDRWFDYSNTLIMLGRFESAEEVVRDLDRRLPMADTFNRSILIQHATKARAFSLAADIARRTLAHAPYEGFALMESHAALLRVGAVEEAATINQRIQASDLGRFARQGAEMRQLCAEGDGAQVAEMGRDIIDEPRARIMAFGVLMMLGDEDAAYERLVQIDEPGIPGFAREMLFNPSVDPSRLPYLAEAVIAAGGRLAEPSPPLVRCPAPI